MIYRKTEQVQSSAGELKIDAPRMSTSMRHTVVATGAEVLVRAQIHAHPTLVELGTVANTYKTFLLDGVEALFIEINDGGTDATVTATGN